QNLKILYFFWFLLVLPSKHSPLCVLTGKGLGRQENGISEAIKVKVKCDKGGIGHKEGDQFTFHWWDHVFNKTSGSLEVQSEGSSGTTLRKNSTDDDGNISNKKPLKASLAKDKLYGAFVKSATLLSGPERAVGSASSSDNQTKMRESGRPTVCKQLERGAEEHTRYM
uniref:G patch domain-containing protein 4 n=1 Tax=Neogobius melanostomus TaxID=47308 RepID=A0A8C6S8B0_9GOBI